MNSKIKILIVDDSKIIQKLLFTILSKESDFQIVGVCSDPFEAKQYISNGDIDCMILDLEMPKMDGLTFLKKLMQTQPIKTIILSGAIDSNSKLTENLMSHGAHAVFAKPNGFNDSTFDDLKKSIRSDAAPAKSKFVQKTKEIILIASSTGGTEGVKKILQSLPYQDDVSLIIIQHMSAHFTKTFADSLDKQSEYNVKEIEHNEIIQPGFAYIAPGNFHSQLIKNKTNEYSLSINQNIHIHSVRPAADVTFLNFPIEMIKNTTAIVLSGMGKDGAAGIEYLKKHGAKTIAESESSCVVFGMPKAAIQTGCIDYVLSIDEICIFLQTKYTQKMIA